MIIAAFVIIWAVLAPKRITDLHAVDAETDPTKVHVAVSTKSLREPAASEAPGAHHKGDRRVARLD